MHFIRNRLFWKFFISIVLTMLMTIFLSMQFERWIHSHQSVTRIDNTINQLIDVRDELHELLANEELTAATELLLNNPSYQQQFLIFDSYDNEILNRQKILPKGLHSRFSHGLKREFNNRGVPLHTEIFSYLGNRYEIIIEPKIFFQPLFSPRLAGTLFRIGILLLLGLLVSYFLTQALTKRIRHLQVATKKMTAGEYQRAFPDNMTFKQDELGQLGQDFQHLANKLNDSNHARKQILSDISHELRSPLARLQVAIEIAKDKAKLKQNNTSQLQRIEKEANRMNDLIAQILHIQQLQMGESQTVTKHILHLQPLLQQIINDVQFEYQNSSKTISLETTGKHLLVYGDSDLLHSALENIIRNAMSHTRDNSVVLIELSQTEKYINIVVTDQGEGIAESEIHKIFRPFTRLDNSRNRNTGGYGLGLSIAHAIIQQHQGTITATNRDDEIKGLRMTVKLPRQTKSA